MALRRHKTAVVAVILYSVISVCFFGSRLSWSDHFIGVGSDPTLFMWFLNWWPFALRHGLNPFWTQFAWFPGGFYLPWATSIPALSALAAPLTLASNATITFNVLSVVSPALGASCAFLLIRAIVQDEPAALIGGLIYGFSSYELGQLVAHLNLDFTCLVPLIILLAVLRYRGEISRRRFVLLTGIGLALELGISSEIVASLCTLSACVWLIFFWTCLADGRAALWRLGFDILRAAGLAIVLSLPFLYYLAAGAWTVPGFINSSTLFSADPVNFFLPTDVTWLGHRLAAAFVRRMTGNASEQGAYLGLPLILIVIAYAAETWRHRYSRALILGILFLSVASLGPVLHLDGVQTRIPLPWQLVKGVPLIQSALPTRFTLYVSLCVAIAVSAWIAAARNAARLIRLGLAVVGYLFLLPNPKAYIWAAMPRPLPVSFTNMPNLVILPLGGQGPDMAWQLESGMRFTQSGGYMGFPPYAEWQWPVVKDLLLDQSHGNIPGALQAYCASHHVGALLLASDTPKSLVNDVASLGWPTSRYENVTIVTVPKAADRHYLVVKDDYWPSFAPFNWMGGRVEIKTIGQPAELAISGLQRPKSLPPVQLDMRINHRRMMIEVGDETKAVLELPAGSTTLIDARKTFRFKDFLHDGDYRHLSVMISVARLPR